MMLGLIVSVLLLAFYRRYHTMVEWCVLFYKSDKVEIVLAQSPESTRDMSAGK